MQTIMERPGGDPVSGRQAERCPRFDTCNASVCPLDDRLPKAVHLAGEATCFYLRASGKAGAAERFRNDPTFAECVERLPAIVATHPDIGRSVERAAKTGFRKSNLRRKGHARSADAA